MNASRTRRRVATVVAAGALTLGGAALVAAPALAAPAASGTVHYADWGDHGHGGWGHGHGHGGWGGGGWHRGGGDWDGPPTGSS
jgi:Spy/CpxP family protein refolding chaperone